VDDSRQALLRAVHTPSVNASDVAYCQQTRCSELSEFALLCDKYDELQQPSDMARWITDHCLDRINIDSAAAQTARAGDLDPARRQTLAMIRMNRMVWPWPLTKNLDA
jgi:hypothetical protein